MSEWVPGIVYLCAAWIGARALLQFPTERTLSHTLSPILFEQFCCKYRGRIIGPQWSHPEILHLLLTLNQKGTEKWTGWTPWNKWCLSGFMHNNCLWCKWGHPSAATDAVGETVSARPPRPGTTPPGSLLLQHTPGTRSQPEPLAVEDPLFGEGSPEYSGETGRQGGDTCPLGAILLGSFPFWPVCGLARRTDRSKCGAIFRKPADRWCLSTPGSAIKPREDSFSLGHSCLWASSQREPCLNASPSHFLYLVHDSCQDRAPRLGRVWTHSYRAGRQHCPQLTACPRSQVAVCYRALFLLKQIYAYVLAVRVMNLQCE